MLALLLYHRTLLTEIVATVYQTSAVATLFATSHGHRVYVIRQRLAEHVHVGSGDRSSLVDGAS